jgi:hypothetical protein
MDNMQNYNPFGKNDRKIGMSVDRANPERIEASIPPSA